VTARDAGVVVTTTSFGGAEKYLIDIYGDPRVRREFHGLLLGDVPGWDATGLPARPLGHGTKWNRRSAVRSLAALPRTRRSGLAAFDAYIQARHPAFMHVQFKREQVLFSRPIARRGVPVVWTEHGGLPRFAAWRAIAPAYRRAARSAHTNVCVAQHVADDIDALLGGRGPAIRVIEGGIDPNWVRPTEPAARAAARERFGLPQEALVIASIARLVTIKRVELLLEALALVPDAVGLICGDGPERNALEACAPRDRVRFTGFLMDPRDAYRAADVVALPSGAREGFPFGLLEAAAAGLPAVVVADSGLAAPVSGWGEVASEPTPEAYADAILRASRSADPAAPRRWADAHSLDRWIDAHLEVMRSTVA
jgi:glycosyltransferase involved in cell wall biosynthesis